MVYVENRLKKKKTKTTKTDWYFKIINMSINKTKVRLQTSIA